MTGTQQVRSRHPHGGIAGGSGDVAHRIVRYIAAATNPQPKCVRLVLPDAAGRPAVVASVGEDRRFGRLGSARRRQVFRSGVPMRLSADGTEMATLAIQPLVDDGTVVGALEIVASDATLDEIDTSLALVSNLSVALLDEQSRFAEMERRLMTMGALSRLSRQLMRVESPTAALRTATEVCAKHVGRPAATARPDRGGAGWYLVAASGLGARRRAQLRAALRQVSTTSAAPRRRLAMRDAFAAVSNAPAAVVDFGVAVMMVGDPSPAELEFVETVGSVVAQSIDRIASLQWARIRNENADLGMAWTAHELRGPLVDAKVALDRVLTSGDEEEKRGVLLRMRGEIEQLTDLVDPLLRWSAGIGSLDVRPFDLVVVTARAVESCVLDEQDDRVVVTAPETLFVRGDAGHIRSAITNLVRNALAYSPPDTPVRVVVKAGEALASIAVSDRGPGIDPAERHIIFDPFARGRAAGGVRGKGLGLFIVRRVVEAHGGRAMVRSRGSGATFTIELPLAAETRQRSAS